MNTDTNTSVRKLVEQFREEHVGSEVNVEFTIPAQYAPLLKMDNVVWTAKANGSLVAKVTVSEAGTE